MSQNRSSLDWLSTRIVQILKRENDELIGSGSIVGAPPRILTVAHLFQDEIDQFVVLDADGNTHAISDVRMVPASDLAIINCPSISSDIGSISISKKSADFGDHVTMGGYTNAGVKRGLGMWRREVTSHGVIERPSGQKLAIWGVPPAAAHHAMSGGPVVLESSLLQVGVIYGFELENTEVVIAGSDVNLSLQQRTRDLFVDFGEIDEEIDDSLFGGLFLKSLPLCTDKVLESLQLLGLQARVILQSDDLGDVVVASLQSGYLEFSVGALILPSGIRISKEKFEDALIKAEQKWSEQGLTLNQKIIVLSDDSMADPATWRASRETKFVYERELIEKLVDATGYLLTKQTVLKQEMPARPLDLYVASQKTPRSRELVLGALNNWLENEVESQSLFLLGGYGAGKTTSLKMLFIDLCQKYLDGVSDQLPVYVSLADAHDSTLRAVFNDVWSEVAPAHADRSKLYKHLAGNDRIVLLLDGFDELVGTRFNKISRKDLRQLSSLLGSGSKTILTSRLESWELPVIQSALAEIVEESGSERFDVFSLVPITTSEMSERLSAVSPHAFDQVGQLGSLAELCNTPFFFQKLIEIFDDQNSVQDISLGGFLSQVLEAKVSRDIQKKMTEPNISVNDAMAVMEDLAEAICRTESREVTHLELQRLIENHFQGASGFATLYLFEIIHTGFLEYRNFSNAFSFKHQIFLDYFQARVCSKYLRSDLSVDTSSEIPHALRARLTLEAVLLLKDFDVTQSSLHQVIHQSRSKSFDNIGESAANAMNCLRQFTTDFSGSDFSSCIFVGADFGSLELQECSFFGATIVDSTFEGANLDGVDMREADLRLSDLKSGRSIYGLDYCLDSKIAVVGSSNHTVEALVFDASEITFGQKLADHLDLVCCVKVSPNGELVASGGQDLVVNVVRLKDGKLFRRLRGHLSDVRDVVWLDNDTLVSFGRDYRAVLWDVSEEKLLRLVDLGSEGWSADLDAKNYRLFVGLDNGELVILSSEDLSIVERCKISDERICSVLHVSSKVCAVLGCNDGAVYVTNGRGEELWSTVLDGSPVKSLCHLENEDMIMAGTELGILYLIDVEKKANKVLQKVHADAVGRLVAVDEQHVLSCGHDGRVCMVNIEDGSLLSDKTLLFENADFSCEELDLRGAKGLSSARLQHLKAMGAKVDVK